MDQVRILIRIKMLFVQVMYPQCIAIVLKANSLEQMYLPMYLSQVLGQPQVYYSNIDPSKGAIINNLCSRYIFVTCSSAHSHNCLPNSGLCVAG